MKSRIATMALISVLAIPACDRNSSSSAAADSARQQELERKTKELEEREATLVRQEQEQKLAAERAQLENDRAVLASEKAALEQAKQTGQSQQAADIANREQALGSKEDQIRAREDALLNRESEVANRESNLTEQELALAGREAVPDYTPIPDVSEQAAQPVGDYGSFYDGLSPYGSWFETSDYGYVWQPRVVADAGWRPYTHGRWGCTNRGWAWISDEPFGWACYHYGRWALLRGRGWVWVPGDEWAPSWVCWHESPEYLGWAPMPPETMSFRHHGWGESVEHDFGIGPALFTFVAIRHMGGPLFEHCLPVQQNFELFRQTRNVTNITVLNNQIISGGPRFDLVRSAVGKSLPFYSLNLDRTGKMPHDGLPRIEGSRLNLFAPALHAPWNAGLKPRRLEGKWDDVKPEREEAVVNRDMLSRYNQSRLQQQQTASDAISKFGGEQALGRQRDAILQENMRKTADARRLAMEEEARKRALSDAADRRLQNDKGTHPVDDGANLADKARRDAADRLRLQQDQEKNTMGRQAGTDEAMRLAALKQQQAERAAELQRQQLKGAEEARNAALKLQQDNAERVRSQQEAAGAAREVALKQQQQAERAAELQRQQLKGAEEARNAALKLQQENAERMRRQEEAAGAAREAALKQQQQAAERAAELQRQQLKATEEARNAALKLQQENAERMRRQEEAAGAAREAALRQQQAAERAAELQRQQQAAEEARRGALKLQQENAERTRRQQEAADLERKKKDNPQGR